MALVKYQSAPWGDPLMFENPGVELYFGEVYRQILQESWVPSGSDAWERLGISRRGRRPTQKGLYPHSPTGDQSIVRQCFSKCAAAWRSLPWVTPVDQSCDNRWGKDYWLKLKDERGIMCSYYDLYMRLCLRHCLDTGCIPPANYLLSVTPVLTDVECNKVYDISFSNNCGEVIMVSGAGQFIPPNEWVAPKCGSEGILCFKDSNGSYGSTTYSFSLLDWCSQLVWPSTNPPDIEPGETKDIYISSGVPPYTWSITGTGFSLGSSVTTGVSNTIHGSSEACGAADIQVIDRCGNVVAGVILCSSGHWVFSEFLCGSEITSYFCDDNPVRKVKLTYSFSCVQADPGEEPCGSPACTVGVYGDDCNPAHCDGVTPCKILCSSIAKYIWSC